MFDDDNVDLGKVIRRYAQSNPDIAFLMDAPYVPEFDHDDSDIFDE